MGSDYKQIKDWMSMSEAILTGKQINPLNEESGSERLEKELSKTDASLMEKKVEKLNLLIKKKYYEADEDLDETKMFQFRFEDRGDSYEFVMPLTIIFGKRARQFAARYWDDFFEGADMNVGFENNIEDALKKAGHINLTMKINKKLTKEVD